MRRGAIRGLAAACGALLCGAVLCLAAPAGGEEAVRTGEAASAPAPKTD